MGRKAGIAVALLAVGGVGVASAGAVVVGGANVRASFDGWLSPHALPRDTLAPVALHLKGALSTTDGHEPPSLRRISIAINRDGRYFNRGLPTCNARRLRSTTTAQALAICRGALVGHGSFEADVLIPSQAPFPSYGRMVAFNARSGGRPAIVAHIFGTSPVPTSQVLLMKVTHVTSGAFGITLSARLPTVAGDWGHVTGFHMTLQRSYLYKGSRRSLLEASCPAPRGFSVASFSAAKGTYYLDDGRALTRVLTGSCKVSPGQPAS